jgi:hypothetical protein
MDYKFKKSMMSDTEQDEKPDKDFYISDENSFIRFITQLDAIPNIVPNSYLAKHQRRIMFSGKFKALSNINNSNSLKLNNCYRLNMGLAEEAGQDELADETLFDCIDMMQMSRGINGFLQNALITQRREFKDNSERQKNKGFWGGLLKNKKEEDEQQGGY